MERVPQSDWLDAAFLVRIRTKKPDSPDQCSGFAAIAGERKIVRVSGEGGPALRMQSVFGAIGMVALVGGTSFAKNSKPPVPAYVLRAHTVAVVVDPDAGISLDDPTANQAAQRDVEAALLSWGRFTTVLGPQQADLVIVLRRGHGKLVEETVTDPRQNSRVGSVTPTRDGIGIGVQHGPQPGLSGGSPQDGTGDGMQGMGSRMQVGGAEDSFVVYEGKTDRPMDEVAGWRWVRKDGLHAHDVPAVGEFRKAIVEAEKQAAAKHP